MGQLLSVMVIVTEFLYVSPHSYSQVPIKRGGESSNKQEGSEKILKFNERGVGI